MIRICAFLTAILMTAAGIASAQDTVIYYHTDAIGSVRMITDANGGVVARYDYLPFGGDCAPNPPCVTQPPDTKQFAGKDRDTDTAFDYFGARYYDNAAGRFSTVDPGHIGGNLLDPQSWNAYSYSRNNPLRFIDPLGLSPCQITLTGADAQAAGVANGAAVDGECVQGTAGTGQATYDVIKWMLRQWFVNWWQETNRVPGDFEVVIAGVAPPAEGLVAGSTAESTVLAGRSAAITSFYPPANGFLGTTSVATLRTGALIDRYGGSAASRFFSPQGTPLAARSLPANTAAQPLRTFEVLKPFGVESGRVAPWFGQSGLGIQYRSPLALDDLVKQGFLREVR